MRRNPFLQCTGLLTVNVVGALSALFTVTTTFVGPDETLGTVAVIDVFDHGGVTVAVVDPNFTVPCVVPKFVPMIVTDAPGGPEDGENELMLGATVNVAGTLFMLLTATTTLAGPAARLGTVTLIELSVQDVTGAGVDPNCTVPPGAGPKCAPLIVTDAPGGAEGGESLTTIGRLLTVNGERALVPLSTDTTKSTGPGATLGTVAVIEVSDHGGVTVAVVVPNFTVPGVVPRFAPLIVTDVPGGPAGGDSRLMLGGLVKVNVAGGLSALLTVTTMFVGPGATLGTVTVTELSDHGGVTVAVVVPNFTALSACWVPNFVPLIVTDVPGTPEAGESEVMLGVTVYVAEALSTLLTDTTTDVTPGTTLAPLGTMTSIDVADQDLIEPPGTPAMDVPPNLTRLLPWVSPKFVPAIVTSFPGGPEAGEREVMLGALVNS